MLFTPCRPPRHLIAELFHFHVCSVNKRAAPDTTGRAVLTPGLGACLSNRNTLLVGDARHAGFASKVASGEEVAFEAAFLLDSVIGMTLKCVAVLHDQD
jgi:hypothetical protein